MFKGEIKFMMNYKKGKSLKPSSYGNANDIFKCSQTNASSYK